jgi:hypothetical protein
MIFHSYSDRVREDSNDENEQGSTTLEFAKFVHAYIDSRPYDLWKYFGTLTVRDHTPREVRRMLAIWTSMLERKAGRHKFRIVTGVEIHGRSFLLHVFIGGVVPGKHF